MRNRSHGSAQPVVRAFTAWVDALIDALPAPKPTFEPSAWRGGRLVVKVGSRAVPLVLSAPNTVVATLWFDHEATLMLARDQPPGRWNRVVTVTRCDGAPHDRYLELVAAMYESGERAEAQLAWMQARRIQDADDRDDGLFVGLFARLPRAASIDVARSAAALLERLLPFARSKSAVDRMIVAGALCEHVLDASNEISGRRLDRFVDRVDRAISALSRDRETSIVDAVKLARMEWARCLAFATV